MLISDFILYMQLLVKITVKDSFKLFQYTKKIINNNNKIFYNYSSKIIKFIFRC